MEYKKYISSFAAAAVIASSLLVGASASAHMMPKGNILADLHIAMPNLGVVGKVTAVNGATITVNGEQEKNNDDAAQTFTVNASNATVTKNGQASSVANIAVGDMIVVQGTVNGTVVTATTIKDGSQMPKMAVMGTVTAVSGNTITVSNTSPKGVVTVYTVNAANATVTKNGSASTVSAIAVGDKVSVMGTVSGTTVTATSIKDGMPQPVIQGNGQPVVAGKITAISGSTITITNNSNVTYNVNAASSQFSVKGVTNATISNLAVGDTVVVQGTVNGNNVIASSVIDQKASANDNGMHKGFFKFGGFADFFKHLFGF